MELKDGWRPCQENIITWPFNSYLNFKHLSEWCYTTWLIILEYEQPDISFQLYIFNVHKKVETLPWEHIAYTAVLHNNIMMIL